jgi:hypothetical protein
MTREVPRIDPDDILPESVELVVEEATAEGRPRFVGGPRPGSSLAGWRAKLGGDVGWIRDPLGRQARVSLEPWAGRDPDATWIRVYFKFRQRSLIGTRRPPDPPEPPVSR